MSVLIHHIAIRTQDFWKSYAFYTKILECQVEKAPYKFKTRNLCFLRCENLSIELFDNKPGEESPQSYNSNRYGLVHFAIEVKDFPDTIKTLKSKDVKFIKDPFIPPSNDVNQVMIAKIEGPDGQEIEIRDCKTG